MAAADAQLFWLSSRMPNDQFLIYGFDGRAGSVPGAIAEVRARAARCPELRLRVADDSRWRYPRWVDGPVLDEQFVVHDESTGDGDFAAVGRLEPLDATRAAWRVHVFRPDVVVIQISHALGDGTRSAALAGVLLGRRAAPPPPGAPVGGHLLRRAFTAARAQRDAPAPVPGRPALSTNAAPSGTRGTNAAPSGTRGTNAAPSDTRGTNAAAAGRPALRTILVKRDAVRTPTVTVAVLSAIGEALGGYLAGRGEDTSRLGAEVPVATAPITGARNNFRNVGIGLYAGLDPAERRLRIAAALDDARRRGGHPSVRAGADAFAATPAWLLRWGIGRFDPTVRSPTVTGNTVVSSVNRGPADLSFGGRPVRFTAGFPALSPMQRLTHGVHGVGDTVAVSVHADPAVVDVDDYLDRLAHALS